MLNSQEKPTKECIVLSQENQLSDLGSNGVKEVDFFCEVTRIARVWDGEDTGAVAQERENNF